jgi:HAD superfamily hydrolase (TIGR01509 family)
MSLKAILFNFNGVIIKDDFVHQKLIDDILLAENLSPSGNQYQQLYQGKSDRLGLKNLFALRGRILDEQYLDHLLQKKATAYQEVMEKLEQLPIIDQVVEFILKTQTNHLPLAIVTGAIPEEVEYILKRANLRQYFTVIIGGNDISTSKPSPEGYFLAVEKLNELNPELLLETSQCLAIEDTPIGIAAAKNAGIQVVGVANTYPFHMLQRQSNWCVDRLLELDLEWVEKTLAQV